MSKPTGAIIYRGPSMIDSAPIVVVALHGSKNRKTGDMIQTYILRADMDPMTASKTGADVSICGHCIHRGNATFDEKRKQAENRTCYVLLFQGPLNVYRAAERGRYPDACDTQTRREIGAGRNVRLGTYGDPAAAPDYVWTDLLFGASGHTGYSHQAGCNTRYLMRSVDNKTDAETAWARGERTFRVVRSVDDIDKRNEILCPASAEAGHRTTCDKCRLCSGAMIAAKSIAIPAHGAGAKHFIGV